MPAVPLIIGSPAELHTGRSLGLWQPEALVEIQAVAAL
jgi:hypothetical protein